MDRLDLIVVEKASEVYQIGREAWRLAEKLGPFVMGSRGQPKRNPAFNLHLQYARELRQFAKMISRIKEGVEPPLDEPRGIQRFL